MSVPSSGIAYLCTYSGILRIIEQILDVTVITFLGLSGYTFQGYLLNIIAISTLILTLILTGLYISGFIRKSKWPWHWIECIYLLITGILLVVAASIVISVFTRGYIITGVIGYVTAIVYFIDTLDKYHLATTPQPKYAWTTPNMPDLN